MFYDILLNTNVDLSRRTELFCKLSQNQSTVNCQKVCAIQRTIILLVRLKCKVTDPEGLLCVVKVCLTDSEPARHNCTNLV